MKEGAEVNKKKWTMVKDPMEKKIL